MQAIPCVKELKEVVGTGETHKIIMNAKELVYEKQSQIFSDSSEKNVKLTESWFDETTADYWLHNRMYEAVDCIVSTEPDASWLTVGDGRWGLDSIRMKKRGARNVLPTDICETLLKTSKQRGLIDNYSVENAEKLNFKDNEFDYAFCKESYHHFPRPYIALYEMLRVASKAVFLVEPNDEPIASGVRVKKLLSYKLQNFLSKVGIAKLPSYYGKVKYADYSYEDSGNYVFSISQREAQKIAQGLNLPQLIVKGFNNHYIKGCEFEPADVKKSKIFKEIVEYINDQDDKCQRRVLTYSGIMIGFLKESLNPKCQAEFVQKGWTVINLPRNPHL
ncbi:MAG: class I SAM-dependent methyltransferase [Bacteroidales bacterium]|nr:class I SAM-dependent methyltransferase [Bacteroidales bacterium]